MASPRPAPDRPRPLPPFAALRAFEAVGRLGAVRRAAADLGVDHAVVSRHLRALEVCIGAPLWRRDRRGGELTEMGRRYHARLTAIFADLAQATAELRAQREPPRLRIWCVPGLAFQWLNPRLAAFRAGHPRLVVELRPSDARPDLDAGEAEVDLRFVGDWERGLPAPQGRRVLVRPEVFPVASPSYLADRGPLSAPTDLLQTTLLHEESVGQWAQWFAVMGAPIQELNGPRLWHAHLALDAARRGDGVALANALLAAEDLAAGRLQRVSFAERSAGAGVGAYVLATHARPSEAPQVAAFRRWITAEAEAALAPTGDLRSPAVAPLATSRDSRNGQDRSSGTGNKKGRQTQ